jgi:hypothetical protein
MVKPNDQVKVDATKAETEGDIKSAGLRLAQAVL